MSGAKSGAIAIAWILIILGGGGIYYGWQLRADYAGLENLSWAGSIGGLGATAFFLGVAVMCATLLATYVVEEIPDALARRMAAAAAAPPLPPAMQLQNQPVWQPPAPPQQR